MENKTFGKKINFQRLAPDSIKILTGLWKFSLSRRKESFVFDNALASVFHFTNLKKNKNSVCQIRAILDRLYKKDAVAKLTENADKYNPQVYYFKSTDWTYTKEKIQIGEKIVPKKVSPKKPMLTLEDTDKFSGMDLAFIGYTIRTEVDVLKMQRDTFEHDNAKLKGDVRRLEKESKIKPYVTKIEDMNREMATDRMNFKKELRDKDRQIEKLNQKIVELNVLVDRQEKSIEMSKTKAAGFKMGEVANFKGDKPTHLRGG